MKNYQCIKFKQMNLSKSIRVRILMRSKVLKLQKINGTALLGIAQKHLEV